MSGTMFSEHVVFKQAGRFIVLCVVGLFGFEWYIYQIACQPTILGTIFFNVFFILALWSYLMAACTDPGTPNSPEWKKWKVEGLATFEASLLTAETETQARRRGWSPGTPNKCHTCGQMRPERAHHCGICRVCILRMDHHCPWIGNCIGWGNHKYFLLLNLWAAIATLTWLLTLRGPSAKETLKAILANDVDTSVLPLVGVGIAMVLFIVTFFMSLHSIYMASRNYTTIEELFKGVNPYAYSSCSDNIRQLLGPIDFKLLLPLKPVRTCDGISYPVVGQYGQLEAPAINECTTYGSTSA